MSAIECIMSSGMAEFNSDMSENDRLVCNKLISKFGNEIRQIALDYKIRIEQLSVLRVSALYIGKDKENYFFAFVDKAGGNLLFYQDFSILGVVSRQTLIDQLEIKAGKVNYFFEVPILKAKNISEDEIRYYAMQYVNSELKQEEEKMNETMPIPELEKYIKNFRNDYPKEQKTAFIIMKFGETKVHNLLVDVIKETLKKHNIIGLRADDKEYADDLFANIRTYMHCTDFGISIFERVTEDNFNPNVSLEVGYMMGLGKPVCLLKDQTLQNLHTDLVGKLYKSFDTLDIEKSLPYQLEKWLKDKNII